jgi:hypothetical protein
VCYQPVRNLCLGFWVEIISSSTKLYGVLVTSLGLGTMNTERCCQVISWKITQSLHSTMANGINDGQYGMALQKDNSLDHQRLFISVNAPNSTISFVLDTLIIHRDMVGPL